MTRAHADGTAMAVIDQGPVGFVDARGLRDAKGDPLTAHTVMSAGQPPFAANV